MRGMLAASRSPGPRITAAARVVASRERYRGLARKAMSPGPAESSVATPVMGAPTSPTASPPRRATISRSVRVVAAKRPSRAAAQRADDLVGDVDAPAREDRLLHDEVELLLL